VGKVKLPIFLQQQLAPKEGNIILIKEEDFLEKENDLVRDSENILDEDLLHLSRSVDWKALTGKWIGKHQGSHYYTVGQRKGLKLGGFKEPLFILATDTFTNTIYVGEGERHAALYRSVIFIPNEEQSWLQDKKLFFAEDEKKLIDVRIRYRQPLEKAWIISKNDGVYLVFFQAQRAVARGQFAAWYYHDELIGSGRMIS
jgi:tRNA-specific 2-thiouridylase